MCTTPPKLTIQEVQGALDPHLDQRETQARYQDFRIVLLLSNHTPSDVVDDGTCYFQKIVIEET